jgi:hypothetical protein
VTRRQVHGGLTVAGAGIVLLALAGLNLSTTMLFGLAIVGLGIHGLWKTDPR